jgi:hemolysin activation/secretion protein
VKNTLLLIVVVVFVHFPAALPAAEKDEGTFNLLVPIAFYTSDTGFAGGGLFQRLYPSGLNFSLAGFYTQKNQVNVFYNVNYFSPASPWWIQYDGSGRYYPESFYGIGEAADLDDEEGFTSLGLDQTLRAYRRTIDGLYMGPSFRYRVNEFVDPDAGGLIDADMVTGSDGYQIIYPGVGLGTGREPVPLTPSLGIFYEAVGSYAMTIQGDKAGDFHLESDFRLFYDLSGSSLRLTGHQLAFQQVTLISGGDLPFFELPSVGGGNLLRGYAADRFRDATAMALQADYRFPVYGKFKGALFGAAGNVAPDIASIGEGGLKTAWGIGLRYQTGPTPDTSFRLDIGWTGEGYGVYFLFGEAY